MQIRSLKSYTEKVKNDQRFRSGNHFIEVNEKAKSITIDFENRDYVHLRFEGDNSLVKLSIKGKITRKVLPLHQVQNYLEDFNLDLRRIMIEVPYLRKTLSLY